MSQRNKKNAYIKVNINDVNRKLEMNKREADQEVRSLHNKIDGPNAENKLKQRDLI